MLSAIPAPADDPLLDSSGNVVLDSSGQPESDPNETFHQAKPQEFDPAHTNLVQAAWLNGIGCPTNASVATYPATSPTGTYSDPACSPTLGYDPKDQHNEGLLMVKTGPTSNNAAAVAELKKVKGIVLTELGYDIRKYGPGTHAGPFGSHCGAGAPRFDVETTVGSFFIGCSSPPPTTEVPGQGWIRLRWGKSVPLIGFSSSCGTPSGSCAVTGTVTRIQIVFDEGQDAGPDFFGAAILDNIDVNGMLVGHGATDAN